MKAGELNNELPELKEVSQRNIDRMIAFYREYPFLPRPAANTAPQPAASLGSGVAPALDSRQPVPPLAANVPLTPEDLASSLPSIEAIELDLSQGLATEGALL